VEFKVLGPVEVVGESGPVELGGGKPRKVLAVLLANLGRWVSVDRLVDEVWGQDSPASAVNTLQSYLSRLRRGLGADRLVSGRAGYCLMGEGAVCDAAEFERLIEEADSEQDRAGRRRLLTEALSLWRGNPYEDVGDTPTMIAERARLGERRLVAVERRVAADLDLGEHQRLVSELELLVDEHPWRERLWGQLMLAYYRSGRQADALAAYRRLRNLLAEGLGIEPGLEIRRLEEQILLQDPALNLLSEDSGHEGANRGLPSGTVTFLFTDIERSTSLWEEHPYEMAAALAEHDRILAEVIEAAGGNVFSSAGDSQAAAFSRAGQALHAAISGQLALQKVAVEGVPLLVRMAIHTAEVEERHGDYFGPALNRAGRLRDAAHGGQILLSHAVAELIGNELPDQVSLLDLGQHRLRDLTRSERIYQVTHRNLPATFPPLRTLDATRHNLPIQLTSFVGRDQELAEVDKLLRGSRLVTLTGVGGAGKTRLALQAAAALETEFPDGRWLADLAPLSEPHLVTQRLADVLGLREQPNRPMIDSLVEYLRTKKVLLVLDNCEHVIDPASHLVAALLGGTSALRILATSRESLRVPGEVAYAVPALGVPKPHDRLSLPVVTRFDAVRLFTARAETSRPGFRLTAEHADTVVEICRRLDGIPLAIELAASRLTSFSLDQIAIDLDQRLRLLTGGTRTTHARQQTLQATIDWSYELLDDQERLLFPRLSVFRDGFSLNASRVVCSGEGLDEMDVLQALPRLVDKSLVGVEPSGRDMRYRLLETLRLYASGCLDAKGPRGEFEARHATFFLSLAEEAESNLRGAKHQQWIQTLEVEHGNLLQALRWNLDSDHIEHGMRLAGALYRFWLDKGRLREGTSWFQAFLSADQEIPEQIRAKALLGAGSLAGNLGRSHEEFAIAALVEAVEIYRAVAAGDQQRWEYANALNNLAVAFENRGEYGRAEASYEEALKISRRLAKPWGVAVTLTALGDLAARSGRLEQARVRFEEAVAVARQLGVPRLTADTLRSVAGSETDWGNPNAAIPAYEEAIQLFTEADESIRATQTRVLLAMAHLHSGDLVRALELFLPNASIALDDPDSMSYASSLVDLALFRAAIDLASDNPERAAIMLGAVDALIQDGGDPNTNKELQQRIDAELHQTLEATTFHAARTRGSGTTPDQIRALIIEPIEAEAR